MSNLKFPTEIVDLPSKGLLYPKDNPLSSGKVEMKYMTAKEEDILTNINYIKQGTVVDKLLQSMIISKINTEDLLLGDKDALIMAARILGYGKDYSFKYISEATGAEESATVDLTELKEKELDSSKLINFGVNEFGFEFPHTDNKITFKLLTQGDENKIEKEIQGLKKIDPKSSTLMSTRLKHMILSLNGDTDQKTIRDFVDNYLLAKDSKELRAYVTEITPGIELKHTVTSDNGVEEDIIIPLNISFLWPDA